MFSLDINLRIFLNIIKLRNIPIKIHVFVDFKVIYAYYRCLKTIRKKHKEQHFIFQRVNSS